MTRPVCKTCNDTHRMTQAREGDNDRVVMCTSCPVPCQRCRAGGRGAFCEKTPCRCACHVEGTATARAEHEDLHYRVRLACATLRDVVGSNGPESIESFARRAAAKIEELEAASSLQCAGCGDIITPGTMNAAGCGLGVEGWTCGTCVDTTRPSKVY